MKALPRGAGRRARRLRFALTSVGLASILLAATLAPLFAVPARAATTATVTSNLNLRSGPRTDQRVRLVMPAGATVEIIGGPRRGFYKVVYNGRPGWAHGDYLDMDGGSDDGGGGGGTATVIDGSLNLRAGPSTADRVLAVMPDGASVTLLGGSSNGFLEVSYRGTAGWAFAAYLDTSGGGGGNDDDGGSAGSATTTSNLNLRAGPSTADRVLAVIPGGATVTIRGDAENGFYPVRYGGQNGWASATYLRFGNGGGGANIVWPFESGASWVIIQGYNGGTHQNRSARAQYYYSFDLARVDGNTAGQSILSPVTGTIRWNDPNSGGILIDMGNGFLVAMFHTTFRGDLTRGTAVRQGEYLGFISAPGGAGYQVTPHVEMTLWASSDGGQSRTSSAYIGSNAISGTAFPEISGFSQYEGTVIEP